MSETEFCRHLARLLSRACNLAHAVAEEGVTNRMLDSVNLWVFSLVARVDACGRATKALIAGEFLHDARLLTRALGDSTLDLCYILHGPLKRRELADLIHLELVEDQYRDLAHGARSAQQNIEHFCRRYPRAQKVADEYNAAVRHPRWTRRWRHIPDDEKRRVLNEHAPVWAQLLQHPIENLGNAAAHARPEILQHYVLRNQRGRYRVVRNPLPGYLYAPYAMVATALCCVLLSIHLVANAYYLDRHYLDELEDVVKTWQRRLAQFKPTSHR